MEGPIELQRWTYTAVKAYQMAMAIQALKLAEEKVASVVKAEAPRGFNAIHIAWTCISYICMQLLRFVL